MLIQKVWGSPWKKSEKREKNRYQNGIAVKGKHSHVCSISAFLPFPFSINLHGQPLLKKKKSNFWGISVSFYSIIPIIPGWVKIFKDIISVIRDHMPKIFIYILDFFFCPPKIKDSQQRNMLKASKTLVSGTSPPRLYYGLHLPELLTQNTW